MAIVKEKEATLIPEQRLEQALVPGEARPHPIPGNWMWVRLKSICNFERGITFPASAKQKEMADGLIPCLRTANIQEKLELDDLIYVDKSYMRGNVQKLVQKDDIIMSSANSRELVGKTSYVGNNLGEMTFGGFVLAIRANHIQSKFLFYMLQLEFMSGGFIRESTQTTNIANINTSVLGNYAVPLPPLAEQQRIVERIESLFSKLDEAREKAQSVLDSFEIRKVTILQKAIAGDLTAQWRKNHDMKIENWKTEPLIEIASLQTGLMKGKRYDGETIRLPYLRVANVQDGFLNLSEVKEIEVDISKVSRYSLKEGDVLFTEGGDFDKLGRGTVWEAQIPNCLHQNHIFVVRPNENILNPYFLSYQAGSKYGKSYFLSCSKQTTNLASINSTQLKAFPVKLPSLPEQIEIVSSIRNLLEIEQRAQELVEVTLDRIDLTKKSILAHAFCGELGTNDPNEDSALHLLKSILSEDNKTKPRRVATTIPKEDQEMAFTIVEALQKFGRLTPEELKEKTKLDIDEFYSQVKQLVDDAIIIEIREGDESYLEVVDHANR